MKINILVYVVLLIAYLFFIPFANAENIHFNNDVYELKTVRFSDINKGYENEYFPGIDVENNWKKLIGIYHYSDVKDPLKFARRSDEEIEKREGVVLLKFIENKKQNKAVLSFLEVGESSGNKYFEHNIFKYEQSPVKGMVVLRYAKKFFFKTKDEITKIGHEVKSINDDLIEQIIISPIPPIIERN